MSKFFRIFNKLSPEEKFQVDLNKFLKKLAKNFVERDHDTKTVLKATQPNMQSNEEQVPQESNTKMLQHPSDGNKYPAIAKIITILDSYLTYKKDRDEDSNDKYKIADEIRVKCIKSQGSQKNTDQTNLIKEIKNKINKALGIAKEKEPNSFRLMSDGRDAHGFHHENGEPSNVLIPVKTNYSSGNFNKALRFINQILDNPSLVAPLKKEQNTNTKEPTTQGPSVTR